MYFLIQEQDLWWTNYYLQSFLLLYGLKHATPIGACGYFHMI